MGRRNNPGVANGIRPIGGESVGNKLDCQIIRIVEIIPYNNFREKIRITKQYDGKAYIKIYDDYIYIERYEEIA